MTSTKKPILIASAALVALAVLFAVGHYAYVHLGGDLLARTSSGGTLPAGLLLTLALVGGAASFFSPCSLAITPSFLVYFVETNPADAHAPALRRRVLRGSAVVAIGIVAFYAAAGALVGWIGVIVYNYLIYLIPVVGIVFLALGALILFGHGHALEWLGHLNPVQPYYETMLDARAPKTQRSLFAFGVAYGAASHTCTLPIFLGIVLIPLAGADYGLAGATVLLYGLAIAALLLVMAYLGQGVLLALRRGAGQWLQYATGALFVLTAGYLFYYFALNYGVVLL